MLNTVCIYTKTTMYTVCIELQSKPDFRYYSQHGKPGKEGREGGNSPNKEVVNNR